MRFFNTAGPVDPVRHYCVPPLERIDLVDVLMLVDQQKYFVMHAPRQTGKTTCMLALMAYLNGEGRYRCLYCNVEAAQAAREDVEQGMNDIMREMASRAQYHLEDEFLFQNLKSLLRDRGYGTALNLGLTRWARQCPKPLVLIIDEIDALVGDTLISVLRQLRSGYDKRPAAFPQSIVLCGVRDVRDYRIHSSSDKEIVTGGSAFNIKSESLRVGDFIETEVQWLLDQHTMETGQEFTSEARQAVWDATQGQPWLVNAVAYEACFRRKTGRDRRQPIGVEMIRQAVENLVVRRETHLDQLADKLREERVRRVVEPILTGLGDPRQIPVDDVQYVADLGLIQSGGHLRIANPVYREIIPRQLTYSTQLTISHQSFWYMDGDGRLIMDKLLDAFQAFFREHSESWLERFDYKEAGPQLLMQAFLQRIVNSGGRVEREYGLGTGRTDLLVIWPVLPDKGERDFSRTGLPPDRPLQRIVVELKVRRRESLETVKREGLEQTRKYMDRCGADEGYLIVFDRRPGIPWEEKLFKEVASCNDRPIGIWGM